MIVEHGHFAAGVSRHRPYLFRGNVSLDQLRVEPVTPRVKREVAPSALCLTYPDGNFSNSDYPLVYKGNKEFDWIVKKARELGYLEHNGSSSI